MSLNSSNSAATAQVLSFPNGEVIAELPTSMRSREGDVDDEGFPIPPGDGIALKRPGREPNEDGPFVPLCWKTEVFEQVLAARLNVFSRGRSLVGVGTTQVPSGRRGGDGKPEYVELRGVRPWGRAGLRNELSLAGRDDARALCWEGKWLTPENKPPRVKWWEVDPPADIVATLHEAGEWRNVRPVVGIATAPFIRQDGAVVQADGYDPVSGWIYAPTMAFHAVPDAPSQELCGKALAELRGLFADFPWVSPAHADLPVAGILTGLCRAAIAGDVPIMAIDASTAGSGKTLSWDVVSEIVWGSRAPKMTFPSSDDELEKMLGAIGLAAAPVVAFDNVPKGTPFGGAPLDKHVTAGGRVQLRVLGASEAPTVEWRTIVLATGNNLTLAGDTTRRVLMSRLEPSVERPEERTGFTHPDLLGHVRANRATLVLFGLAIVRGYIAAGRPAQPVKRIGGFEDWCDLIASAIVWAGGSDVCALKCMPAADPKADAVTKLFEGLHAVTGGLLVSAAEMLAGIYPEAKPGSARASSAGELESREALEELHPQIVARQGKPTAVQLGALLRANKGAVRGGFKLEGSSGRVARWRLVKVG